jgi:hypothetical protein
MKILIFAVIIFVGSVNLLNAQSTSDSVYVYKSFLGYKYIQHDARLNFNQLPDILNENQEAYLLIKKARTNNIISSIISGTGGFLIGWQLGTALVGGDPNWTLAAVGGGLIVISIPIYSKSMKQSLEAIDEYNAGLGKSSRRPNVNIGLVRYGFGLSMNF